MSMKVYSRRKALLNTENPPLGYEWCDYIENTSTAYIDTGIKGGSNIRLVVDFMFKSVGSTAARPFIQNNMGDAGWSYTLRNVTFLIDTSNGRLRLSYGRKGNGQILTRELLHYQTNTRYLIEIGFDGVILNGKKIIDVSAALENWTTQLTDESIKIFNTGGTHKGLLYGYKIYTGDAIVRDCKPIMRLSDGKVGLWNKVNQTFNVSPNGVNFVGGVNT